MKQTKITDKRGTPIEEYVYLPPLLLMLVSCPNYHMRDSYFNQSH